jgi:hypothetical protein
MVMERLLEFLRPQERVGEVGKEPCGHDASEPVVEDHGCLLEPVAGVDVGDRGRKEAKAKRNQNEVEHWASPGTKPAGAVAMSPGST